MTNISRLDLHREFQLMLDVGTRGPFDLNSPAPLLAETPEYRELVDAVLTHPRLRIDVLPRSECGLLDLEERTTYAGAAEFILKMWGQRKRV